MAAIRRGFVEGYPMARSRAKRPSYSLTLRAGRFYVTWWENGQQRRISARTDDGGEASWS